MNISLRCGSALNELSGECPLNGPGIYPNCICRNGKSFDPQTNSCISVNQSVCPKGATGIHEILYKLLKVAFLNEVSE